MSFFAAAVFAATFFRMASAPLREVFFVHFIVCWAPPFLATLLQTMAVVWPPPRMTVTLFAFPLCLSGAADAPGADTAISKDTIAAASTARSVRRALISEVKVLPHSRLSMSRSPDERRDGRSC